MTPLVTAAVLLAAVTRAGRNAIAHRITGKPVGFTRIAATGLPAVGTELMPRAGQVCLPRGRVHGSGLRRTLE